MYIDIVNFKMNVGVAVDTPDGRYTAHAVLLQCSADLQARGPMTNMKNFNGKWGCLYCTNPGETTESDQLHRFWPYKSSAVLRSPQSFIDDGKAALQDGDAVSSQVFKGWLIDPLRHVSSHLGK